MPEDLTIDNTEWLMKDPYEYYWFNWEGAVKYGEVLMRKYPESTTAKKEKRQFEASSQKQSPEQNGQTQSDLRKKLFAESGSPNHDLIVPTKNEQEYVPQQLQQHCSQCLIYRDKFVVEQQKNFALEMKYEYYKKGVADWKDQCDKMEKMLKDNVEVSETQNKQIASFMHEVHRLNSIVL